MNTYTKSERLKSRKLIDQLFEEGLSFNKYPLRVVYCPNPQSEISLHQTMFVVPKKRFKSAVDRNLIRRRMLEAYRLNKNILYHKQPVTPYLIAYIYIGKEIADYQMVEEKLKVAMLRLVNEA
ncbi:MAG: ribonuclease P protein component [Cyclobacteriaceae bacterium]